MSKAKGLVKEEIINDIISMIIQGTINKGDFLPSIRSMSTRYNISRGTVLVIYKHLESMGYIQGFERSGYVVVNNGSHSLPTVSWVDKVQDITMDSLHSLSADNQAPLAKLLQRKPCKLPPHFIKRWASNYDNFSRSSSSLSINHLQRFLKLARGITIEENTLMLHSGYQEALTLIALFLQQYVKRKVIIVQEPCAANIKELFTQFQFDILSVATDHQGLQTDDLPDITDASLLCMPTLHYPTATRLSEDRREQLYHWAADRNILLIEDDSYAMLGFGKTLSPPLYLHQKPVTVIYLTQLIEILGSAYNLAMLVLPPTLIDTFRRLNLTLSSTYPPTSYYMVESFLSSSYLMKYLTTLIEERHAKSSLAKTICSEQLLTRSLNFQQECGFCYFTAEERDIAPELINTVFFPVTSPTLSADKSCHFLFPHTLLTLTELEKISSQLTTLPSDNACSTPGITQKKSPHY